MDDLKKQAQINTVVGLIAALIQDSLAQDKAALAGDVETSAQMRRRIDEDKDALRRILDILLG